MRAVERFIYLLTITVLVTWIVVLQADLMQTREDMNIFDKKQAQCEERLMDVRGRKP